MGVSGGVKGVSGEGELKELMELKELKTLVLLLRSALHIGNDKGKVTRREYQGKNHQTGISREKSQDGNIKGKSYRL